MFEAVEQCWDDKLTRALIYKLNEENLNNSRVITLLRELVRHGAGEARAFAEMLISKDWRSTDERDLAVNAAAILLRHASDAGWEVVWQAILKDAQFGQEVCLRMAGTTPRTALSLSGRLTEDQLADLYIWLVRQYPHRDDPRHEGMHAVGPRESVGHWRDSLLAYLRDAGTVGSCDAIRRIIRESPDLDWLKWVLVTAEHNTRRKSWSPPCPTDVIEMLANKKRRLVRNGEELLDALIESLQRLEAKFQGETPAAMDVWSQVKGNIYSPKDENHFSDYVQRFLDEDLKEKGIILNREVEIRRSMGGAPGERTDIHVDAVMKDQQGRGYDSVNAIIEVKGSWNRNLATAMQAQLIDRYLKDNRCRHGLYLVGWFKCPQWDSKDPRKKPFSKSTLSDVQAQFDAQATFLSVQYRLDVRAMVINSALR